jgi:hypothetical protein
MPARRRRDFTTLIAFLPLVAALIGAIAAIVSATAQGLPLPLDVAGVLLLIGLAASAVARATPLRGALFILALSTIVVGIIYGG